MSIISYVVPGALYPTTYRGESSYIIPLGVGGDRVESGERRGEGLEWGSCCVHDRTMALRCGGLLLAPATAAGCWAEISISDQPVQ